MPGAAVSYPVSILTLDLRIYHKDTVGPTRASHCTSEPQFPQLSSGNLNIQVI